MKRVTSLLMFVLLLTGIGPAQPTLSANGVSDQDYVRWLGEKDALWTSELEQLRPFMSERVQPLEQKQTSIRRNAQQIGETPESKESKRLKSETHLLVYSLEKDLEGLYADLERASNPAIVLDL